MLFTSEEDDQDYFTHAVFPVSQFDEFDESKPPANGQDYLRRVQLEAKKYPEVSIAHLDVSLLSSHRYPVLKEPEEFIQADPAIHPSKNWQLIQIENFVKIKKKVEHFRKQFENKKKNLKLERINLKGNEDWWRKFCLGTTIDELTRNEHNEMVGVPLLSNVLRIPQNVVNNLLFYNTKWLKQFKYSHQIGLWIFSLLACLEQPFNNDVYSTLRTLSRICSQIRAKHVELKNPSFVSSLNLIICIIGRYYDQFDLTDSLVEKT